MTANVSTTFDSPKIMRVDGTAHLYTQKCLVAAAALNDTFDFVLPGGVNLAEMALLFDDCDTGTTLVVKGGYTPKDSSSAFAPNLSYFGTGITTGQAGGRYQCVFKPIQFDEDMIIRVTVTTATTGISGTPELWMIAGADMIGPQ